MKVLLHEGNFKDVRTKCTTSGETENNIEVGRTIHRVITEFQEGAHIKREGPLLQGKELEDAEP